MWKLLDLKEVYVKMIRSLNFLRVTSGSVAWVILIVVTIAICWPMENWHVTIIGSITFFLFVSTFRYSFSWVRERRSECKQVLQSFYDLLDKLPSEFRQLPEVSTFYQSVTTLAKSLDDPHWREPTDVKP